MRQKIVAGNWKMNGNLQQLKELSQEMIQALNDLNDPAHCVVFPPFVYLAEVEKILRNSIISLGGQNLYPADSGAYTGEISAPMLKDLGCKYVLVGHSERRHIFREDENFVADKFHHAKEHGIIPVLCLGEVLDERENQQTQDVVARQLLAVAEKDKNCFENCIIAYEPVWAIGTGKTASPEQAQEVHQFIRTLISEINEEHAARVSILYGGSVNEKNAAALFSMPDIDGGLVGGASLNAKQFVEIVKCIN